MFKKKAGENTSGILAGYSSRLNPLTTRVYMLVKIDNKTIKVPIDCRQQKFIQKEYKIGSMVELEFFDGNWHVISQTQPSCELHLIVDASPRPMPEYANR